MPADVRYKHQHEDTSENSCRDCITEEMRAAALEKLPVKRFHFDVGNSTKGQVGVAGIVLARDKQEALEILHRNLPDEYELMLDPDEKTDGKKPGVEYICVFCNTQAVKLEDIEEE